MPEIGNTATRDHNTALARTTQHDMLVIAIRGLGAAADAGSAHALAALAEIQLLIAKHKTEARP